MPTLSSYDPVPWQSEIVPQGWGCGVVTLEWGLVLAPWQGYLYSSSVVPNLGANGLGPDS